MPSDEIIFDMDGLYLLLSDIGAERQFHWGLYLAKEPTSGVVFHLIKGPQTGNNWVYQAKSSSSVPNSLNLLLDMKITVLEPALHGPLIERLAKVPVEASSQYGPITCRVWIKVALQDLDDEGYIKLMANVDEIEDEAVQHAAGNKMRGIRAIAHSALSIA